MSIFEEKKSEENEPKYSAFLLSPLLQNPKEHQDHLWPPKVPWWQAPSLHQHTAARAAA